MNGQMPWLTLMPEDFILYKLIIIVMKKLSLEMLRLSTNEILERSQMKKITGGYGSGGPCCIHLRSSSSGAYLGKSCDQSLEAARGAWFMGTHYSNGTYASGYCCASC
ncbi:hypothetical protein Aconfl_39890 [Algoriphagus confluentis]|uniref:Uncharacterized protein n=1 Tax=Algoriphagus confluentis TaxID=1697556 RepID=A0ABQ6PVU9_9BACT|nr:hypothetical protein Aconfl_39890 [Algoriphagus confluentis]